MKTGIRWNGNAHTVSMDSCPCCQKWVQVRFRFGQILGVKHATFPDDLACPYVAREHANPHDRYQRVVFDYADLESRCIAAREAVRKAERRDARLDGRPKFSGDNVAVEDLL